MKLNVKDTSTSRDLNLLGLSVNEELVLKAFIELGETSPMKVTDYLKLDKSTVYKAADDLVELGFLVKTPLKYGATYSVVPADYFSDRLNSIKFQYSTKFDRLATFIEQIKANAFSSNLPSYITVERGYEAHKAAMRRILTTNEKLLRQKINTNHKMYDLPDYRKFLAEEYIPTRIKNGINIRILLQYFRNDYVRSINTTNPKELKEVRILSGEFSSIHSFKIYADYFDITVYGNSEMPDYTISIRNLIIADMMREIYDYMWARSPIYYTEGTHLKTRKLFDGTKIPLIGLGTRGLYSKDAFGPKAFMFKNPFYDQVRSLDNITYNFHKGITYIDNSKIYGNGLATKLMAFAIRNFPRDQFFINGKIGRENGVPVQSTKNIEKQCDWYLKQYKTDYLDSIQMHGPSSFEIEIPKTIEKMTEIVKKGKAKYISVSNFSVEQLKLAQSATNLPIISNEVLYNYFDRTIENNGVLDYCRENNILVIAYRPLGLGSLCGREEDPGLETENLVKIAKKYNKTSGQIALNWLLNKPNTVALIKSTNSTHINENVASLDFKLYSREYEELDRSTDM